jgi:hypothetical protein
LCQIDLFGLLGEVDVRQWCSIIQKVLGCTTIFFENVAVPILICVFIEKELLKLSQPCQYYQAQSGAIFLKEFLLCTKLDLATVSTM